MTSSSAVEQKFIIDAIKIARKGVERDKSFAVIERIVKAANSLIDLEAFFMGLEIKVFRNLNLQNYSTCFVNQLHQSYCRLFVPSPNICRFFSMSIDSAHVNEDELFS